MSEYGATTTTNPFGVQRGPELTGARRNSKTARLRDNRRNDGRGGPRRRSRGACAATLIGWQECDDTRGFNAEPKSPNGPPTSWHTNGGEQHGPVVDGCPRHTNPRPRGLTDVTHGARGRREGQRDLERRSWESRSCAHVAGLQSRGRTKRATRGWDDDTKSVVDVRAETAVTVVTSA